MWGIAGDVTQSCTEFFTELHEVFICCLGVLCAFSVCLCGIAWVVTQSCVNQSFKKINVKKAHFTENRKNAKMRDISFVSCEVAHGQIVGLKWY